MKDLISRIEQAIHHLPTDTAEEIQQETSWIIRHAKPQKNNTLRVEREALLALRNDDSIMILPADKGNATVILSSTDYNSKIRALLDELVHKRLTSDPTSKNRKTDHFPHQEVRPPRRDCEEGNPTHVNTTQAIQAAKNSQGRRPS
jgi:hypothetical protein